MQEEETTPHFGLAMMRREDLSEYSVDELDERITSLRAEIERCEVLKASKQGALNVAESVFRK